MNIRTTLATGLLFLCGSIFLHALSANALPQGPNVSMGSNPIESWAGEFTGSGINNLAVIQNDFIITDFTLQGAGVCTVQLSSSQSSTGAETIATGFYGTSASAGVLYWNAHFVSGMKVDAGSTIYAHVSLNGSSCYYNISGYYPH